MPQRPFNNSDANDSSSDAATEQEMELIDFNPDESSNLQEGDEFLEDDGFLEEPADILAVSGGPFEPDADDYLMLATLEEFNDVNSQLDESSSFQLAAVSNLSPQNSAEIDDIIERLYSHSAATSLDESQIVEGIIEPMLIACPEAIEQELWDRVPQAIQENWERLKRPNDSTPGLSALQQHVLNCVLHLNFVRLAGLNQSADLGHSVITPVLMFPPAIPVRVPLGFTEEGAEIRYEEHHFYDLTELIALQRYAHFFEDQDGQEVASDSFREEPLTRTPFRLEQLIPQPELLEIIQERLNAYPIRRRLAQLAKDAYPDSVSQGPGHFGQEAPNRRELIRLCNEFKTFADLKSALLQFIAVPAIESPSLNALIEEISASDSVDELHQSLLQSPNTSLNL